jgi:hypothetical protein
LGGYSRITSMKIEPLLKSLTLAVLLTATLTSSACFDPLRIEISEENLPTFTLRGGGGGALGGVSVREYPVAHSPLYLWATGSGGRYLSLSYFHPTTIKYGDRIADWGQDKPADGSKPPPLLEGQTYQVIFSMVDRESRAAVFTVRNGKVVQQDEKPE